MVIPPPSFQFQTYQIIGAAVNDSFVTVLYQYFGFLTVIFCPFMGQTIDRIGFLQDGITDVFFIFENLIDIISRPDGTAVFAWYGSFRESLCDDAGTFSIRKAAENFPYQSGFLFNG